MPATSNQPSLFDDPPMPEPYRCDYECGVLDEGGAKPKSKCTFRGSAVWTNCRECGHCLWDGWWQRGTCDGLSIDDGGEEE